MHLAQLCMKENDLVKCIYFCTCSTKTVLLLTFAIILDLKQLLNRVATCGLNDKCYTSQISIKK